MSNWFDYPSAPNGSGSSSTPWPASGDGSEAYPVLPICITIDTSGFQNDGGTAISRLATLPGAGHEPQGPPWPEFEDSVRTEI